MIRTADETYFVVTKDMALKALRPTAKYSFLDGAVVWADEDVTQPTEQEIQAQIERMEGNK
jgi:hypothetical protein